MKLTIKTETLKTLLDKSIKGASNNKMLPITSMLEIKVSDNTLRLTTTDGSNYLVVTDTVENEDMYVVVYADVFNKLISKTTSEFVSLEVTESSLIVKGNGTYTLELPVDENGELVKLQDVYDIFQNLEYFTSITKDTIDSITKTNKSSLSISYADPCYTGYYLSDKVITSDGYKICCNNIKICDKPILISPELMNLIEICGTCDVATNDKNECAFIGKNITVYGKFMNEIEKFKVVDILNLLDSEVRYSCWVNRNTLLSVLDRISLFVSPYDTNAIKLSIGMENLTITNLQSNSSESIKYDEGISITAEFNLSINVELLKSQLQALNNDTIKLCYGNDKFIKLVDDKITEIVALVSD